MLKFTPSLFAAFFSLISLTTSAQITLESTDLTSIGDQILRYVDTVPAFGPGGDGANQTWDFSAAQNDTLNNTSVVAVSSTPYSSTFSGSDYAMTNDGGSFLYFNHNSSTMSTTGAAGDLLGTGEIIEAPFTDALKMHEFPRTYGSNFNDTYAFEAEADGAAFNVYRIKLNHTGHVFDTTDAYGTLITPTGSYNAIRVKTVDFTQDVIEVQLSQFVPIWTQFANVVDTSVSYTWHAEEEMLAIAEMTFDSIGNPSRFVYSSVLPVITTEVVEASEEEDWMVHPQPAVDFLHIKGENSIIGYYARVHSVDGRLLMNEPLLSSRIALGKFNRGVYILRLTSPQGIPQKPIRFLVVK